MGALRTQAKFHVGQLVEHRLFGYRGVVVDVDAEFEGSDEWYREVAKSMPPRDQPWYQVLVDGSENGTYVAERNLQRDELGIAVENPGLDYYFDGMDDGVYLTRNFN